MDGEANMVLGAHTSDPAEVLLTVAPDALDGVGHSSSPGH
jgi:hypothetical protein